MPLLLKKIIYCLFVFEYFFSYFLSLLKGGIELNELTKFLALEYKSVDEIERETSLAAIKIQDQIRKRTAQHKVKRRLSSKK